MSRAKLHPRVVITTIVALCVMAWVVDCALSSTTPPDHGAAAAGQVEVLRHEAGWHRVWFERVADVPNLAALEEDEDEKGVRESIRTSSIVIFDRPVLKSGIRALLVLDCDSRYDSPGGRRGPPPRMPPA